MDAERTARVAVLGVGTWGRNIVRDLVALGVEVIAVDPDPAARVAAQQLGATAALSDLSELRDEVAGVIVSTPASQHERDVLSADALGVPIACEKPLATSTESARRIVDAVGDRLTVLHVWRYHPAIELLGDLVSGGRLGQVRTVRSTRTNWTSPRLDVHPVWTLLPHDLSIAHHLLGGVPELTTARVQWHDDRAVAAWATFEDRHGRSLVAEVSTRTPDKRREVRVDGDTAVAVWTADDPNIVTLASGHEPVPQIETVEVSDEPALRRELRAFVDHVLGGPPPPTDAAEGLAVVEAVEATLAAGRTGTASDG